MKIEVGKFYKARDGKKVRIYATDGQPYPIHGAVKCNGDWLMASWSPEGISYPFQESTHNDDIVSEWREPITVCGWVNVYPVGNMGWVGMYTTKERADESAHPGRSACIYVTGTSE